MGQQVRQRQQALTIPFAPNSKQSQPMGRGMVYREIYLQLQGQLALTAAANVALGINPGDEWAVVKRVTLKANGTDVIKTIQGQDLRWLNYYQYGTFPVKYQTAIGDGITVNPLFDSTLILPLWMPRSIRPLDTALDSRELSDLTMQIDWGDYTDIATAATGFLVNPTMTIHSLEAFNVSGPFSQWRVLDIIANPTGAQPRFQVPLPVGPMYRGFQIREGDGGFVPIIDNFKLISGSTVFADVPAGVLESTVSQMRRGQQFTSVVGQMVANDPFSQFFIANGLEHPYANHFYDHVTDGFNTEAIDTLGFSEFIAEFKVNAAGTITIIPMQIIPVRGGM